MIGEDFIPIPKAETGRRGRGTLSTFRYNPKTGVAALSLAAWRQIGEPESVGVWYSYLRRRVVVAPLSDNSGLQRKVSKKRTFSVTALREILPEETRVWDLGDLPGQGLYFDVEQGRAVE